MWCQRGKGGQALRKLVTSFGNIAATDLYHHPSHFVWEVLQNADDNTYEAQGQLQPELPSLSLHLRLAPGYELPTPAAAASKADGGVHRRESSQLAGRLEIRNNERGFLVRDVEAICTLGSSSKVKSTMDGMADEPCADDIDDDNAALAEDTLSDANTEGSSAAAAAARVEQASQRPGAQQRIGKKGLGFKSLFALSRRVEVHSGFLHFAFDTHPRPQGMGQALGRVAPVWAGPADTVPAMGHAPTCEDSAEASSAVETGASAEPAAVVTAVQALQDSFPRESAPLLRVPPRVPGTRFLFTLERAAAASSGAAAQKRLFEASALREAMAQLANQPSAMLFLRRLRHMRVEVSLDVPLPAGASQAEAGADSGESFTSAATAEERPFAFTFTRREDVELPLALAASASPAPTSTADAHDDALLTAAAHLRHSASLAAIVIQRSSDNSGAELNSTGAMPAAPAAASVSGVAWWLRHTAHVPVELLRAAGLSMPQSSLGGSRLELAFPGSRDVAQLTDAARSTLALPGGTELLLSAPASQPVCCFLPLCGMGLRFLLQADWEVPADREKLLQHNAWNTWLAREAFPSAFIAAFSSFCALAAVGEPSVGEGAGGEAAAGPLGEVGVVGSAERLRSVKGVAGMLQAAQAYLAHLPQLSEDGAFLREPIELLLGRLRHLPCLPSASGEWISPRQAVRSPDPKGFPLQVHLAACGVTLEQAEAAIHRRLVHPDLQLPAHVWEALRVSKWSVEISVDVISAHPHPGMLPPPAAAREAEPATADAAATTSPEAAEDAAARRFVGQCMLLKRSCQASSSGKSIVSAFAQLQDVPFIPVVRQGALPGHAQVQWVCPPVVGALQGNAAAAATAGGTGIALIAGACPEAVYFVDPSGGAASSGNPENASASHRRLLRVVAPLQLSVLSHRVLESRQSAGSGGQTASRVAAGAHPAPAEIRRLLQELGLKPLELGAVV